VKIRPRLTLSFTLVAALSTLVAGLFLNRAISRHISDQTAHKLWEEARLVRDLASAGDHLTRSADDFADRLGRDLSVRVTIISAGGKVLGDTDLDGGDLANVENHSGRPEVREAMQRGAGQSIRYSATLAESMLYVALRTDPADPSRGVVRLAVPLTAVRKVQEEMRLPLLTAGLVSILAAALLGWVAARRPAGRLAEIARTAAEIASGATQTRAPVTGRDEVSDLARSVNRMADQLAERLALLSRERNELRSILDGMVEGVILTDDLGTILLANRAFERILGVTGPVTGRRPVEVVRLPALQEAVDLGLRADKPIVREISLPGPVERVIRVSLAALRHGDQRVGAVAVFHDVTELKKLENLRRDFVANVSHELRTPLTAIRGYVETLRDGGLDDPRQAAEFIAVIHRHTQRLQALIEDLLDLSAVEQGKARLHLGPLLLREAAAHVEAVIRPAAEAKRQTLSFEVPGDLPWLLANSDGLARVLINLLDNAVKFTPEGGEITLSAFQAAGRVVLSVTDSGVGIPSEEIARIFERFYRVDHSRDRQEGGTGLGLAITKHLTQAMGGTIDVESAPGRGTTFRLTFPAA